MEARLCQAGPGQEEECECLLVIQEEPLRYSAIPSITDTGTNSQYGIRDAELLVPREHGMLRKISLHTKPRLVNMPINVLRVQIPSEM